MINSRAANAGTATTGWSRFFRELVRLFLAQDFACGVHKGRSSLEIERAFGAVEAMLFILVALGLGKFAEHILYSGLQSYRFTMVHLCHPIGSAGGCNIVSLAPQLATRCATPSWPFSYKTLNLSLARCRSTLK